MIVKSLLNRLSIEIFRFSYSKEYERNTVGINSVFFKSAEINEVWGFLNKIQSEKLGMYISLHEIMVHFHNTGIFVYLIVSKASTIAMSAMSPTCIFFLRGHVPPLVWK